MKHTEALLTTSMTYLHKSGHYKSRGDVNKIDDQDRPAHDWYRFVLSFPPHLVREYLKRFGINSRHRVLDPFCGAGTTIVECKKLGIPAVGIEANPLAHFVAQVKIDWSPDPDELIQHSEYVAERARAQLEADGIEDDPLFPSMQRADAIRNLRTLEPDVMHLLLKNSISPLPLHKVLVLLDTLKTYADQRFEHHQRLALAKALPNAIGNLHFGPEVGVGPAKPDTPVIAAWLEGVATIARDLRHLEGDQKTGFVVS
jgi:SAM-dependent methyltransferase